MSEEFDAYYLWLGIAPAEQPPNHYQLLGIRNFEHNPAVIDSAADRQMMHVRTFQSGEHAEFAEKILNKIAAARICLLDASNKMDYDRWLFNLLESIRKAEKSQGEEP